MVSHCPSCGYLLVVTRNCDSFGHTRHARDAKIYLEDPGPWIMGLSTEARYITRIQPEICICDL